MSHTLLLKSFVLLALVVKRIYECSLDGIEGEKWKTNTERFRRAIRIDLYAEFQPTERIRSQKMYSLYCILTTTVKQRDLAIHETRKFRPLTCPCRETDRLVKINYCKKMCLIHESVFCRNIGKTWYQRRFRHCYTGYPIFLGQCHYPCINLSIS